MFNECIDAFWQQKFSGDRCIDDSDDLQIAVSSALNDELGMILVPSDGRSRIVVQEKVARAAGMRLYGTLDEIIRN
ncbi:hypothetical protein BLA18109_02309 [Burkholderia lata]|uniref:Uncharacterized protein n=1 Tax=Burkholderia lata (strain ATCC 17760 / DSM 23089 / LMG 22485 / NCIMB 9086 / R18194 / 383) TaxID=482957 RepID=A0A6P2UFH2_BURL3|nr:hypothetical protein BLA18109_02309 [Burkholderia lata]